MNQIEYVNDHVTRMYLVIDTVMTYTQGNVLSTVQNAFIERQHLPREVYNYLLPSLRNNDDVIKASKFNERKTMVETDEYYFNILDLKDKINMNEKIYFEVKVEDFKTMLRMSKNIELERTTKQQKRTIEIDEVTDECEGFIEDALEYGVHYTDFDNEYMRETWKKIENQWEEIEKLKAIVEKEMEEAVGIM